MDWIQVFTIIGTIVGLFIWLRTESRNDFRAFTSEIRSDMNEFRSDMNEFRKEMSYFHGRLSKLEERQKHYKRVHIGVEENE